MMSIIQDISQYLGKTFGFYSDYVELVILTILIFLAFGILKRLVRFFYSRADVSNKKKYFRNRMIKVTLDIISIVLVVLL